MNAEIRKQAEEILSSLGLSPELAQELFYRQVILWKGLPFGVRYPGSGGAGMEGGIPQSQPVPGEPGANTIQALPAPGMSGAHNDQAQAIPTIPEGSGMEEDSVNITPSTPRSDGMKVDITQNTSHSDGAAVDITSIGTHAGEDSVNKTRSTTQPDRSEVNINLTAPHSDAESSNIHPDPDPVAEIARELNIDSIAEAVSEAALGKNEITEEDLMSIIRETVKEQEKIGEMLESVVNVTQEHSAEASSEDAARAAAVNITEDHPTEDSSADTTQTQSETPVSEPAPEPEPQLEPEPEPEPEPDPDAPFVPRPDYEKDNYAIVARRDAESGLFEVRVYIPSEEEESGFEWIGTFTVGDDRQDLSKLSKFIKKDGSIKTSKLSFSPNISFVEYDYALKYAYGGSAPLTKREMVDAACDFIFEHGAQTINYLSARRDEQQKMEEIGFVFTGKNSKGLIALNQYVRRPDQ